MLRLRLLLRQVLADASYKQKVLDRTPMRRVGETHEVSGARSHVVQPFGTETGYN